MLTNVHGNLIKPLQSVYFTSYILPMSGTFVEPAMPTKLEALNKRILRFILGDYSSPHTTLLSKANSSTLLRNKRFQNFLIFSYEFVFH